jgi:polyisoprenoid-binding protein YceI
VSGLARYRVDPQGSRFTARAFAGGALSAMGHNPTFAIRDFSGEVEFDPEAPAASTLRLVAKAASLALTDNVSDKDRGEIERTTRDEVLETVRGQGEATVRLSEFGIRPVSVAGGMLKVKDEVKLTYDIVARLAPDATAAPSARAT